MEFPHLGQLMDGDLDESLTRFPHLNMHHSASTWRKKNSSNSKAGSGPMR